MPNCFCFIFNLVSSECCFPVIPLLCPFLPSLTFCRNSIDRFIPLRVSDRFLLDSKECGIPTIPLFHGILPLCFSEIFSLVSAECFLPVRTSEIDFLIFYIPKM